MKFEEVLPEMRKGKKARHGRMRDGEYWVCGFGGFRHDENKPKWPTIFKIYDNPFDGDRDSYAWGIERWALMADDWIVLDYVNVEKVV